MNGLSKLQMALHGLSALAMAVFVYLYVGHNSPGLTDVPVVSILGVVYVAMFLLVTPGLLDGRHSIIPTSVSRGLYAATAMGLPLLFLDDALWDEYRVFSFLNSAVIALLVSWLLLVISSVISFLRGEQKIALATVVALISLVFALLVRIVIQEESEIISSIDAAVSGPLTIYL